MDYKRVVLYMPDRGIVLFELKDGLFAAVEGEGVRFMPYWYSSQMDPDDFEAMRSGKAIPKEILSKAAETLRKSGKDGDYQRAENRRESLGDGLKVFNEMQASIEDNLQ